jgi:histidinol-phosphate/aromatic aminotransferase/cobyric acid decarboxylase-like protein
MDCFDSYAFELKTENVEEVTWTSSDPSILSIDENGTATTNIKEGKVTVTAKSGDVSDTCEVTVLRKKELYRSLKALEREDFKVLPSVSNFVVVLSENARAIFDELLKKGIAVRCFNGFLRITAGSKKENAEVISAISEILN